MNEIEDAVFRGLESRDEARPGHRTLRRSRCAETREMTTVAERSQVRQCIPVTFYKGRIHAVNPQHDEMRIVSGMLMTSRSRKQKHENEVAASDYCCPPR